MPVNEKVAKHTPTRAELSAQWQTEQFDHEECPVCHSQCRDVFMGDDLTPLQKAAPELAEALREMCNVADCTPCWIAVDTLARAEAALSKAGIE